jgi:hypothetical protein
VKVTNNNFKGLSQLCEEFHFRESGDFTKDVVLLSALKNHGLALMGQLSLQSRLPESFEREVPTKARSTTRRGNEVEKPIGEIQSDVDDLCVAFREGRVLIEKASEIATLSQKKTESAKSELGRTVRIKAGVSLARTAPVVPTPGLQSTHQLADA